MKQTETTLLLRQVYIRCRPPPLRENYVQELIEKAPQVPEDIESVVPNLAMVETVDDEKDGGNPGRGNPGWGNPDE